MSASVQFMITNAMRATLVEELEFGLRKDVMRPEIAAELIEKNETAVRAGRCPTSGAGLRRAGTRRRALDSALSAICFEAST